MNRMKQALQEAIKAREGKEVHLFRNNLAEVPASEDLDLDENKVRKQAQLDDLAPRVEKVDPQVLKRNRVFSLFHDHEMTDQIALLRTQVVSKLNETGGNSLLVTSALPGEGKTFVSINLGVSLSRELDRTVLIVDADLKNPVKQHYDFARDFFGINGNHGLADYLLGQIELPEPFVNPGIDRLTLLPAGKQLPNSAELLNSSRMKALVAQLKDSYPSDHILIFDSPSLLCSDPLVLSEFVDGILIVVEENRTRANDLKHAVDLLRNKNILGTVLNKSRTKDLRYV